MLWFMCAMTHTVPKTSTKNEQYTQGQGQHIVRVVRRRGDVQKEHQVDSHLGDGQRDQRDGDARTIDDMRPSHPE